MNLAYMNNPKSSCKKKYRKIQIYKVSAEVVVSLKKRMIELSECENMYTGEKFKPKVWNGFYDNIMERMHVGFRMKGYEFVSETIEEVEAMIDSLYEKSKQGETEINKHLSNMEEQIANLVAQCS